MKEVIDVNDFIKHLCSVEYNTKGKRRDLFF